ncbi:MAG: glycosyltransferase family 4 protein [Bacillota bacterium]
MRITFVLPHAGLAGGIRVVAIYAERLKRRGHPVVVVSTPRRQPTLKDKIKSLVHGKGWPIRPAYVPSHLDGLDIEHRVIDRWRPVTDADVPDADVVVATWWETAEWVAKLSPHKGAKAILIQGYEAIPDRDNLGLNAAWRLPLHKILVSQWLAGISRNRFNDSHFSLVPNGVDTTVFCSPPRSKQETPTVGLVYSKVQCKGTDISLQAFRMAADLVPGLRLRGFGHDLPAPDLPLPKGAEYIRRPEQYTISDIYRSCDAWLFGSRAEGFGLPILEAMACRTPVIAAPAGAAPELLSEGGGILIRPEDPKHMAEAITRICQMPEEQWRAMSDAAYATATRYTWDDATDLFEAALQMAIDRNRRGELTPVGKGALSA